MEKLSELVLLINDLYKTKKIDDITTNINN